MKQLTRAVFIGALCVYQAIAYAATEADVVKNYADMAHAVYSDSLSSAKNLQSAVETFLAKPTEQTLSEAKQAWLTARVPYLQSEVFRFGNPIVDDWEGQLNTWPLDEGLIDYVSDQYEHEMGNVGASLNIIATPGIEIGGEAIDAKKITPELIASFNELGGSEANVASGYHAIEFLLWGQDLHGTAPGAGERPFTDYVKGAGCTHGNCDRRGDYLRAATQLLVSDLEEMVPQWAAGNSKNYRASLLTKSPQQGLTIMLFGMGSLALGELAGERMKVALEANSTEDEQDCFSDNTHHSHFYDALGINNIYFGRYKRLDGSVLSGPSLADLMGKKSPALAKKAETAFTDTQQRLQIMVDAAERKDKPMKFDQMIAEGNSQGEQIISAAIGALVIETKIIEEIATAMGIANLNPDTADHAF